MFIKSYRPVNIMYTSEFRKSVRNIGGLARVFSFCYFAITMGFYGTGVRCPTTARRIVSPVTIGRTLARRPVPVYACVFTALPTRRPNTVDDNARAVENGTRGRYRRRHPHAHRRTSVFVRLSLSADFPV